MSVAKVYVIDDDEPMRNAIVRLLNAYGCLTESYASAAEFLEFADLKCEGVVITDLAMPGMTGLELQSHLAGQGSAMSVIVVTGIADVNAAVKAMKGGAITLLEKPFSSSSLVDAVLAGLVRSQALQKEREHRERVGKKLAAMTDDEKAILEEMIVGRSIKATAISLHVSTRTVERHRKAILKSLEVASIPELAVLIDNVRRAARSQSPKD